MTASTSPSRWDGLPRSIPLRAILLIALVALAYHYTFVSLARGLALQTPLAYVALAPLIALILAWIGDRRGATSEPPSDLRLDFLLGRTLGLALMAIAFIIALLVPLSVRFWLNRIDLISLPLFVAGAIALVYGPRQVWRLRFPIAFLLLAWPAPYLPLIGDALQAFTDATISIVATISRVIPIAVPGEEGLFTLQHAGEPFVLAIGSACAGVNSLVGFLVVGSALLYVVHGPILRKLTWLVVGLATVWLLNVLRIEAIFVAGTAFGPRAALDVLHPVAGLIVFNVGILIMLGLVSRMGLTFAQLPNRHDTRVHRPRGRWSAIPLLAVVVGALLMASVNATYARYEELAGALGQPRVAAFDSEDAQVSGWSSVLAAEYDQSRQFYGESSTWLRYRYHAGETATLSSSEPVYVDIITTDDANALAAYGVEACYRFHGYVIQSQTEVDLGAGVKGQLIDYTNTKLGRDWSAIWWEWPYDDGGATRYERVVIFLANGPSAIFGGASDAAPAAQDARFDASDDFLANFGANLVAQQLDGEDDVAIHAGNRPWI